jgi:hypothetical protein
MMSILYRLSDYVGSSRAKFASRFKSERMLGHTSPSAMTEIRDFITGELPRI